MGFIELMVTIFLGLWLFGVVSKWLLRYWLLKKQREMEQQMRDGGFAGGSFGSGNFKGFYTNFGGNAGQQQQPKKPEGEVTIEKTEEPKKHVNSKIGEYVDFEEVK